MYLFTKKSFLQINLQKIMTNLLKNARYFTYYFDAHFSKSAYDFDPMLCFASNF